MSGKHGQLEISSFSDNNRPTYAYVDNNLELGGEYKSKGTNDIHGHNLYFISLYFLCQIHYYYS